MNILDQLSSQVGDRTEAANRAVVARCLADPALLPEIAAGLAHADAALVGDCAEVLTHVAQERPEWVAPYAGPLAALLGHGTTRVRWEAMHALALVTPLAPQVVASLLGELRDILHCDASVIVRDGAVDALANYAGTGAGAAREAAPLLQEALTVWEGKHAARALRGLGSVAAQLPEQAGDLHRLGEAYLDHRRGVVRKAARALVRAVED